MASSHHSCWPLPLCFSRVLRVTPVVRCAILAYDTNSKQQSPLVRSRLFLAYYYDCCTQTCNSTDCCGCSNSPEGCCTCRWSYKVPPLFFFLAYSYVCSSMMKTRQPWADRCRYPSAIEWCGIYMWSPCPWCLWPLDQRTRLWRWVTRDVLTSKTNIQYSYCNDTVIFLYQNH